VRESVSGTTSHAHYTPERAMKIEGSYD